MRRRLVIVLLLLVGGAIVNVAVAWGFHAYGWLYSDKRAAQRNESYWTVAGRANDFHGWQLVTTKQVGRRHVHTHFGGRGPTPAFRAPAEAVPTWSALSNVPEIESVTVSRMSYEWGVGWPCVSLSMSWKCHRDWSTDRGWVEERDEWRCGNLPLPIRVIWHNFAINTVFYAVILWGLFAAPFALRRRRRIRRGLCPACAYPVGESDVCTECGKPVRRESSRVTQES